MNSSHAEPSTSETASRGGVTLFRIGGIQVRLDYSWFLIFLLIFVSLSAGYFPSLRPGLSAVHYLTAGLAASLLFFASILAHELSHSWVAVRSGLAVPDITLFLFGGVSRLKEEPADPRTDFLVAIAGPMMSFALALMFWGLYTLLGEGAPATVSAILFYLAWINLALGVFNLLPGYPLDGGRILRALVWWRTGSFRSGTRVASAAGQVFAIAIMILGAVQIFAGALVGGFWLVLIGMFLRTMARSGYEAVALRDALGEASVAQVMARDVVTVPPSLKVRELIDSYLLGHGYRGYPVVDPAGEVLGLVSVSDVRKLPRERWESTTVGEILQPVGPENRIAGDAPLLDALRKISGSEGARLLVMSDGRLEGLLTARSLNRFAEIRRLLAED